MPIHYIIEKRLAQKSENQTVSKFLNKTLNLNKRKFQFTLEHFYLYYSSDFDLKEAEKVKSLAPFKLTSLPVEESLIPRQKLTPEQKKFLTDFNIK